MERDRQLLIDAVERKKKALPDTTVRLADVAQKLFERQISPRHAVYGRIVETWHQLLGPELGRHSRISDITAGQITAIADSPSYRHELRLCSDELLRQLKKHCPAAKIKKIKFVLG